MYRGVRPLTTVIGISLLVIVIATFWPVISRSQPAHVAICSNWQRAPVVTAKELTDLGLYGKYQAMKDSLPAVLKEGTKFEVVVVRCDDNDGAFVDKVFDEHVTPPKQISATVYVTLDALIQYDH